MKYILKFILSIIFKILFVLIYIIYYLLAVIWYFHYNPPHLNDSNYYYEPEDNRFSDELKNIIEKLKQ